MIYECFDKYVDAIKPITNNVITPGFSIEAIDWKFDYSIDFDDDFKKRYDFKKYYLSLILSAKIFHSKNDTEDILEDLKENIDIMVGYTFLNSVLYAILDCEAVSSGWFNKLRKFDSNIFDDVDKYGKRKKRYTSTSSLTYMTIELIKEFKDDIDISIIYSKTSCDEIAF